MTVNGSALETLYRDARDKIRGGIVATDITGSIGNHNIVRGKGTPYLQSWEGPTGLITWAFHDGENRSDWSWITPALKTTDSAVSGGTIYQKMAMLSEKQYYDIEGLGKTINLLDTATYRISVSCDIVVPVRDAWGPIARFPSYEGGTASKIYLEVDGVIDTSTEGLHIEEDLLTVLDTEYSSGITKSTNETSTTFLRRSYTTFKGGSLSAGIHNIRVLVDPRNERLYATRRNILIECIYS